MVESEHMPIKRAAEKWLRQSSRRRIRNLRWKNKIKSLKKQIGKFVAQKKIEEAKNLLPQVYKALDKAAKVGVTKKNTAARLKSRITRFVQKTTS